MANTFESRGYFWWFGERASDEAKASDKGIPGILKISEEGSIVLELEGELNFPVHPGRLPYDKARVLPQGKRVAGKLNHDQYEAVILESLLLNSFSWPGFEESKQSFVADYCLLGHKFYDEQSWEITFDHFRVKLSGLEDWTNIDALTWETLDGDGEFFEKSVRWKNHRHEYKRTDGDLLIETLMDSPMVYFSRTPCREITFKQSTWLQFAPSLASTASAIHHTFVRIEEFFAVLLGVYPRLEWPYLIKRSGDTEDWYRLYFFRGSVPQIEIERWNILTEFSWMHDSLGDLLSSWMVQREAYGPGYYLFLAGMRKSDFYAEHKFVNLIWALESLHRNKTVSAPRSARLEAILDKFRRPDEKKTLKWLSGKLKHAEEPNLEARIFETFSQIPLGINEKALKKFAKRCADRRNQVSHTGGPKKDESYHDFQADLRRLTEAMTYLYHALLLHEIGLEPEHIHAAMYKMPIARVRIIPSLSEVGLIPKAPVEG